MKTPYVFEALAIGAGVLGAFVLVSGLMPFINPGFVDANETGTYSPRMEFLIPTLLSLPILGLAWHFNRKAQEMRRELKMVPHVPETSRNRKLKWIAGTILVIVVLCAFLW